MEKKEIVELLEKTIKKIDSIRSDVDRASLYGDRASSSYCDYASSDLHSLKEELSQALSQIKQEQTASEENADDRCL